MKRILLVLVVFASIFIVSGCTNNSRDDINFKDDYRKNTPSTVTYKFIGISDHFGFETGKVYYGEENQRYILITNFKIIKELKKQSDIDKYSINLSFNNESMMTDDMTDIGTSKFEDMITSILIEEAGKRSSDGYGESDAFLESTKKDFKDSVKLEIKYCYKNGICETEKLDFKYIEN